MHGKGGERKSTSKGRERERAGGWIDGGYGSVRVPLVCLEMLLANRAETGLSCYLVPLHSLGKVQVSGAEKGWVDEGVGIRIEGGPQDCRDLVYFRENTLEASNTFLGQVTGCLQSQVRFR